MGRSPDLVADQSPIPLCAATKPPGVRTVRGYSIGA